MKMQQTNIIGDAAKERRIDYGLIDRLNKEYESKARKAELEARLAGKKKEKKKAEEPAAVPTIPKDITYIQTPEELADIKGIYSLEKGIYEIDFEIYVLEGNGLILQPGVELYFTKDTGITCEGRFETRGEDGLEVLLTAKDEDDGWKNLYLKGKAKGMIDYTKFSYGKGREDKDSDISGGAVIMEAENGLKPGITIANSCFENNSAYYGGAIFNDKGNMIIKNNNRFENNSAESGGGAIFNYKGNVKIKKNNRFENNSAKSGGAILDCLGILVIDKLKNIFKNNTPNDILYE